MSWAVDKPKLDRVRSSMRERGLDALVVRAPDNVLYLTNYWSMKGYDAVVFPADGEPTLIVIEPQLEDAQRTAWTTDVRTFAGYDADDARPPQVRAWELALAVLEERDLRGRVGFELGAGTQAADRMVGEPTTPWSGMYDAAAAGAAECLDASGLLAHVRAVKTDQELERLRLTNELARVGLDAVQARLRPGMRESEVGALFESAVHEAGIGYKGRVEFARAFTLVWSGQGIRTFTATGDRPVAEHEPTLMEIWVCADGYWTDLTQNFCPGTLAPRYSRLLDALLEIYAEASGRLRPGADLAELDRLVRERIAEAGYPGQPSHPICHGVGARAHEPPFAHQADSQEVREGMVLALEPAAYWEGGGGLRLEDDFHVGAHETSALCGYPADFRLLGAAR